MATVAASIEIARSADEVFAFMADIANNRLWQDRVNWSRWATEQPWRVGSVYEQAVPAWGGELTTAHEVTQYVEAERMSVAWTVSHLQIEMTTSTVAAASGTTVAVQIAAHPRTDLGIWRWLNPTLGLQLRVMSRVFSRRARKEMQADLETLKRFLEV